MFIYAWTIMAVHLCWATVRWVGGTRRTAHEGPKYNVADMVHSDGGDEGSGLG